MSPFLVGVTLLLVFQCAGEALAHVSGLPVPGPVLGMVLLLVMLRARPAAMSRVVDALTRWPGICRSCSSPRASA
jgi:holin-like protein